MMQLKIFKNQFIRTLATDIPKNVERYVSGDFQWTLAPDNGHNVFLLDAPWFNEESVIALNKIAGGEKDVVDDVRDAKALYTALKGLPPYLARDSRFWSTITHTHCQEYVRDRNWKFLTKSSVEEVCANLKSRFFIENTRSYERTNALARLWWYGYIAESTGLPFDEALFVALDYTDFRAATVERPEVFVHKEIRAAVLDLAIKRNTAGDGFYRDRDRYRPLFKETTERATRVFFPTMEHSALVDLLDSILAPSSIGTTKGTGEAAT